jgi:hypothetical protein
MNYTYDLNEVVIAYLRPLMAKRYHLVVVVVETGIIFSNYTDLSTSF